MSIMQCMLKDHVQMDKSQLKDTDREKSAVADFTGE